MRPVADGVEEAVGCEIQDTVVVDCRNPADRSGRYQGFKRVILQAVFVFNAVVIHLVLLVLFWVLPADHTGVAARVGATL